MDENCGMAHNRLAIVDVSGSSQPIISDDGVVLVHNGEIYNNSKIKNETSMYSWKTKGDSESILALYSKYSKKNTSREIKISKLTSGILVTNGYNSIENPATRHK